MPVLANPLPVAAAAELANTIPIPEGPNIMDALTISFYPYLLVAAPIVVVAFGVARFRDVRLLVDALPVVLLGCVVAAIAIMFSVEDAQQKLSTAAIEDGYGVTFLSGAGAVPVDEGGNGSVLLQVDGQARECVITATEQGSFLVRCAADGARMEVLVPQ